MPPKRKRAGDEATAITETTATSRATRSSARGKAAKDTSESGENGSILMDTDAIAPPAKKSRASTKGSTKTGTKRAKAASKAGDDDESGPHKPSLAEVNSVPQTTSKTSSSTKRQSKTQPPAATEPYNPARGEELFKEYVDSDDSTLIGPEGLERLCNDANIALDGALPLILAWQFGCTEMAKITQQEWSSGTSVLKVSSLPTLSLAVHELEGLLLYNKPPPAKKSPEPYNRTDFWKYCENKKEALKKFYFFCFTLAKPEGSRNIDIETASAMWSVLLVPKYPIMSDILAFIGEKQGTYKAANKDLWSMMLEFCETVNPNLTDYESDGAWPTLLDDFVSWKKESAGEPMQTD